MARQLATQKRQQIEQLLGEGKSVREVSRITKAARATVAKIQLGLLAQAGGPGPRVVDHVRRVVAPVATKPAARSAPGGQHCIVFDLRFVVPAEHANLQAVYETLAGDDRRLVLISTQAYPGSLAQWDADVARSSTLKPSSKSVVE